MMPLTTARRSRTNSWRVLFVAVCAVSMILPIQVAHAQVKIGGLAPDDAVCTGADGNLNSQWVANVPDGCEATGVGVISGAIRRHHNCHDK